LIAEVDCVFSYAAGSEEGRPIVEPQLQFSRPRYSGEFTCNMKIRYADLPGPGGRAAARFATMEKVVETFQ
jgi:hypothetical protein